MIISYIIMGIVIAASLLIQGHPSFDVIRIAGVKPDLLFIVIVYLAYSFGSFTGEVTGFIGGIFHDVVSRSPLGLLALPKVVLGFLIGMFGRGMFKNTIVTVAIMIFLASLLKGIITLFLSYIFHQGSVSQVLDVILPEAFYNALVAPFIFILLDKIFEKELEREGHL